MKKIENFILPEHTNQLYTDEAISSVALTKEIAIKINELIDNYNSLDVDNTDWLLKQEGKIRKAVVYMKDNLLNSLNYLMETLRDSGFIDSRIEYHAKQLNSKVNNLIGSLTSDSEIIDIRLGADGETYPTAGESIRTQFTNIISIIETYIEEFKSLINTRVKKNYCYRPVKQFEYPEEFKGTFRPLIITTDGIRFKTDFNNEDYKVNSLRATTYYVAPYGKWTNTGLTPYDPVGVHQAYTRAVNGDNIVFLKGEYRRDNLENSNIPVFDKSLNIYGNNAVWINGQEITPIYDDNTGLYRYDYQRNAKRLFDWDIQEEYTKVKSVAEVKTTPKSFYNGNDGLYVSNLPKTRFIVLVTVNSFQFTGSNKYYIENLSIYGGNSSIYTGVNTEVTIYNCDLGFNCAGQTEGEPIIAVRGGNVLIVDTLVHDSEYDGISYVSGCNFIELNCRCFNNGKVNNYSNGSTGHAGAKGIRINSTYFNNMGGNVADVQTDTQSINLGCIAYDSSATTPDYNHGFSVQQAGTTMWLYNCIAFDNIYDIFAVPDSKIYSIKCGYDTSNFNFSYSGDLIESDKKSINYYMLRLNEHIISQL